MSDIGNNTHMGHSVPVNPDACEWDNPLWPSGQTPKICICALSGMVYIPNPLYPPPPYYKDPNNSTYICTQVSSTLWVYYGETALVECYFDLYSTVIIYSIPDPFARPYQSSMGGTFALVGVNDIYPNPFGYGGGGHHCRFSTDINTTAAAFAVGNAGKTFYEPVGSAMRFAERAQGTCVYIKGI